MATMNTHLAPLRDRGAAAPAYTLEWDALPQPPRGSAPAPRRLLAAEWVHDAQAAADAALAELFPALRLLHTGARGRA